jgi:hypothetical protein
MSSMKKVSVLMFAVLILAVPIMLSENAEGDILLPANGIHASGFDDRSDGTLTVRVINDTSSAVTVNVLVFADNGSVDNLGRLLAANNNIEMGANETRVIILSFNLGSEGTHHVRVVVYDASLADNDDRTAGVLNQQGVEIYVGLSIWSNTWTYIAMVLVIIVAAVALLIRMRSNPRIPEAAGTFTAMEEERKAGKRSSGRERYKGRKKN